MTNKYNKRFATYMTIVLGRIPPDVEKWASCNITLHEPPEDNCVGFAFTSTTPWHVVFPLALFKLPVKERLEAIAHEIAHCYLGHGKKRGDSEITVQQQEYDADELASKWGF